MKSCRSASATTSLLTLALLMLAGGPARGGIINVPADQPTIQAGIEAAQDGDEVVLAPMTYLESGIDLLGKAITLRSTFPDDPIVVANTVINGLFIDTVLYCVSGEGPDTVINGLTIENGFGYDGGGMIVNPPEGLESSPTVKNCRFLLNFAGDIDLPGKGAAIYFGPSEGGTSTVMNCEFLSNAADQGGAIYISGINLSPTIMGCVFSFNQASGEYNSDGGAIFNSSGSPQIIDCMFDANTAAFGAGVYTHLGDPAFFGSTFDTNSAITGGGMYIRDSSPTISTCTFSDNSAGNAAGGIRIVDASPMVIRASFIGNTSGGPGGGVQVSGGDPEFIGCDFIGNTSVNRGGGARVESGATSFLNCRFIQNSANRGGGLACSESQGGDYEVMNCIFSGNSTTASGGGGAIQNLNSSTLRVRNSTIVDNNADLGAGGIRTEDASTTFVYNSIVFFNEGNQIGNGAGGSSTVRHSDVEGGHAGAGNVDVFPNFIDRFGVDGLAGTVDDDLRLSYNNGSIVDGGDDTEVPAGIGFDLGGDSRFVDGDADSIVVVDMGAYERQRPANDECSGAIPVTEGTTAFSKVGATSSGPGEACFSLGYDVWYSYEATSDSMVQIQVTHPTECCFGVAVYDGSCPTESDTAIACAEWPNASLTFLAVSGEVYYIRIGNDEVPYSSGDLVIALPCVADVNGDFSVDVLDLVNVITLWGTDGQQPGIDADTDNDGIVGVGDLTDVILNWGDC